MSLLGAGGKFSFKTPFTGDLRSGWQSNNIFPAGATYPLTKFLV